MWIALLALKDKDGVVHNTVLGLAHRAIVSFEECQEALKFLSSPDPLSGNKSEGGRRIVPVDGGWRIVSHDKYRFSKDAARAYWKESKAAQRQSKKESNRQSADLGRQDRFVKSYKKGDDKQCDEIAAEGLDELGKNHDL